MLLFYTQSPHSHAHRCLAEHAHESVLLIAQPVNSTGIIE